MQEMPDKGGNTLDIMMEQWEEHFRWDIAYKP